MTRQTLSELNHKVVLLGSRYSKAVYLCRVVGFDRYHVWVRYPRNPEGVAIDRPTFASRLRRVLTNWDD
jgi:hypothetical protein